MQFGYNLTDKHLGKIVVLGILFRSIHSTMIYVKSSLFCFSRLFSFSYFVFIFSIYYTTSFSFLFSPSASPTLPPLKSEHFKPCQEKDLAYCLNDGECFVIETLSGPHKHCRYDCISCFCIAGKLFAQQINGITTDGRLYGFQRGDSTMSCFFLLLFFIF